MVVALAGHAQAQLAVIQQQRGADGGGGDDLGVRQVDAPAVAGRRVQVEPEGLAGLQMHPPAGEAADAQFRPLHIGQDADRAVEPLLQLADHGDAGGVILMRCRG